ncbi:MULTISPECIES: BufA2 family periplasmic bufferin-type metallophore [unclassified Cupriavidus]|uniref:BufA2 family periplasmic bufferin-type metallophore n=1 Tax=unclassified Cupriavidus TaxID=2640874 RepID=UPI00088E5FA4|nr:hypothetical protein [Cupriavidus sp. YR651]SDC69250.1 hypothetical protein SAMN05216345_103302 [Cupriavidus sp. YR651]
MSMIKKSSASIAAAAALIAMASISIASPAQAAGKEEPGRCYGVNSCKGTSLCATAKNDCKGLNECKGKGVLVKPKSECLKAGGTLTEPK